jgi:DNA-binding beta-propeller fold protein YncE
MAIARAWSRRSSMDRLGGSEWVRFGEVTRAGGRLLLWLLLGVASVTTMDARAQDSFQAFESGPVRPLALSPDGSRLFATNTPAGTLEVFDVNGGQLVHAHSVPVGLEPVAVAARTSSEVWVVNHLSDSVSIVDLGASPPVVTRTLLVGDEPRDIVFAGTGGNRAFITTAHRGQQRTHASIAGVPGAGDPQLTTPGVPRADVWVFDAGSLGTTIGGTPVAILSFFADTPRALAVSPDGGTVYVAAFHSGNQTTAINDTLVPNGFDGAGPSGGAPGGVPGPSNNVFGDPAPETGLIVKFDGASWRDAVGRSWDALVPFDLPDHDVFAFDANSLAPGTIFDHVGTILFNMVTNPVNGKVYVTNTELPNHIRFEGPGQHGGSTVQGHLSESRISVLDPSGPSVDAQHLNQHIDYGKLHTDVPDLVDPTLKNHSLATPLQPIVSSDGSTLYVAAFGSGRIGVFDTAAIEAADFESSFDPTVESVRYISTPGGPAGLALDESDPEAPRLYALTRFDNQVVVIDPDAKTILATHSLPNPEPPHVVEGRRFLYDAFETSGNGEASCSSCHIFGDVDSLAWNLGDPDAPSSTNTQPSAIPFLPTATTFHPMKGPMTTQTLRGLATHGGMHWRGDRVDGFFGLDPCNEPSGAPCDEELSFKNFIVAFEGLVGRDGILSESDMQKFTDFMLDVRLPPNPVRALDRSLTASQLAGSNLYFGRTTDTVANCNGCHTVDPSQGLFGSGGEQSFEGEPQNFKVPHLRNMVQKVGMFFSPGDQVRGFGFLHDGSVDTLKTFFESGLFSLSNAEERNLEQLMLAFDSDLAPIVGQQVTRTAATAAAVDPRIDLLSQRCNTPFVSQVLGGQVRECDLIVKGRVGGSPRGWVQQAGLSSFLDDQNGVIADADLRALALSEGPLTYTAVPPGSGIRMGIDRDEDTQLDGLDNCPAAPNAAGSGTCTAGEPTMLGSACTVAAQCGTEGFCSMAQEDSDGDGVGDACEPSLVPEPGSVAMLTVGSSLLAVLGRRRLRSARA